MWIKNLWELFLAISRMPSEICNAMAWNERNVTTKELDTHNIYPQNAVYVLQGAYMENLSRNFSTRKPAAHIQ